MAVELARRDWSIYLGALSASAVGSPATVQTAGPGLACRPVRRIAPQPLRTIEYEVEHDALQVAVGGNDAVGASLRCFVSAPRRLLAEAHGGELALLIIAASGQRTVVRIGAGG